MSSDWGAHLGRGRKIAETAAWVGAGSAVAVFIAASAALATWLDRREGEGMAQTIMIDLPPIEAVADAPAVQPEASTETPENAEAPDTDAPPEEPQDLAEDLPEPDQPDLPQPEDMAEALPDTTPPPPPEPEPEPVKPPEVSLPQPKPKPAEVKEKKKPKAEKPAEDKPREEKPREAKGRKSEASQASSAAGGAAAGSASPSQMAKWKSRVQQVLAKHMRRKSYGYRGNVTLVIHTSASGQITRVDLSSSTGNPAADAALRDQAARAKLPPSPRGAAEVLTLPVSLR